MFDNVVVVPDVEFRIGTRLFELYLALQGFHALANEVLPQTYSSASTASCMSDDASTSTNSTTSSGSGDGANSHHSNSSHHQTLGHYHWWFVKGVSKWLDIALLKAVKRIFKAVALDDLTTSVDELVQHTSSAVDITIVFKQVK